MIRILRDTHKKGKENLTKVDVSKLRQIVSAAEFFGDVSAESGEHLAHVNDLLEIKNNKSYNMGMDHYELTIGFDAMPVEISIMLAAFFVVFAVGLTGNLTVIIRITNYHRRFRSIDSLGDGRRNTLQRYVLLIAFVDLLVTIQIPFLFPFLYHGQWLVGYTLCKIFWIVDNVNKLLSVHILTVMAVERFFIVRNSLNSTGRRIPARIVTFGVFSVSGLSLLLLMPLFANVTLDTISFQDQNITTCVSPLGDTEFVAFVLYMFFLGYCVPALVVTSCYVGLLRMLKKRYKQTNMPENSRAQLVKKVSKSIMAVTGFHFVCWTPFWMTQLVQISAPIYIQKSFPYAFMITQLIALLLPYVNCSFNWCFYVLLNKNLRRKVFHPYSTAYSYPTNKARITVSQRASPLRAETYQCRYDMARGQYEIVVP